MSLLTRFKGKKSRDIDDLRNDIIENLSGIISSRAPIQRKVPFRRNT